MLLDTVKESNLAQADLNVANQSGAGFRADLNNQLLALGTLQGGNSPPSATYQGMLWLDTSTSPSTLKQRNDSNNAWVTLGRLLPNFGLAPLNSPAFTDTPTAPTAAPGTNNTQIATTAFVSAATAAATANALPVLLTAQNCAGLSTIGFTGIPAWAKRVTLMLYDVSVTTNSVSILVQLGTSSGYETSAYESGSVRVANGGSVTYANASNGLLLYNFFGSEVLSGIFSISLVSGNIWVSTHSANAESTTSLIVTGSGKKALSGTLDRIRIATNNGADLFDSGTINVLFE
jgi:hypothetical protein